MCHVYADDHGGFVEWCLISENMIGSSKLEVYFQGNIRKVMGCTAVGGCVKLPCLIQNTYRGDTILNVTEGLDLLVCTRVTIGQNDNEKVDT